MSVPDTTYWVDGIPLDDPDGRWFVDSTSESPPTAGVRSTGVIAAQMDGEWVSPNDPYAPGIMSMTINVTDEGSGGQPYNRLQDNLDALKAVLLSRHRIHVLRKRQGGRTRETDMRVTASSKPVELDSRTTQIKFLLDLPLPIWREPEGTDWGGQSVNTVATVAISPLAGATAPCYRGMVRAEGPLTRLQLVDETTGCWVDIRTSVASGQHLALDLSNLAAKVHPINKDVTAFVDVGPGGFLLTPNPSGVTRVQVTREGGAGRVYGTNFKRSYL